MPLTPYRILRWLCILAAGVVTLAVWKCLPAPGFNWVSMAWFVLLAALTELLAVNLADESQVEVVPSSPIYWAAACVMGPLASIVVCVAASLSAEVIGFAAFAVAQYRGLNRKLDPGRYDRPKDDWIQSLLTKVGRVWEPKVGSNFIEILEFWINYAAILSLIVGVSGTVYHSVGGVFLDRGIPSELVLSRFVLPFLGLAAVAITIDVVLYALAMVMLDPIPGARGFQGVLLRMHLVLIETAVPLIRAQAFLVIVSLMLAYLYVRLGPFGFVLTVLPVVALRDFYYQWVQEQSAYLDTVTTLATYMQLYHPYTRGHLKRVADMSERLARELRLPASSIRHIGSAGLLHDIGKIGVSEEILDKTEKLLPEEWDKIRSHPVAGAEIISHLDFLEGIVDWIRYHHKWYDGRGYPDTREGDQVPIEAAIIAVADSFDAMTDDRELAAEWVCDSCGYKPEDGSRPEECPKCGAAKVRLYRPPKSVEDATDELRRGAGTQFHPRVVKAFLTMLWRDGVHLNAA